MRNRQLSAQSKKNIGLESTKKPWKKSNNFDNYYESPLDNFRVLGDSINATGQDSRNEQRIGRFLKEENSLLLNQISTKDKIISRLHEELSEKTTEATELSQIFSSIKGKLRKSEDRIVQLSHELEKRNLRISYLEEKLKFPSFSDHEMKPSREIDSNASDSKSSFLQEINSQLETYKINKVKLENKLSEVLAQLEFYKSDNSKLQGAYQDLLGELSQKHVGQESINKDDQALIRCVNFFDKMYENVESNPETMFKELENKAMEEPHAELKRCFINSLNFFSNLLFANSENVSSSIQKENQIKSSIILKSNSNSLENCLAYISEELDFISEMLGLSFGETPTQNVYERTFHFLKEHFKTCKSIQPRCSSKNAEVQTLDDEIKEGNSLVYIEDGVQVSQLIDEGEKKVLRDEIEFLKQKIELMTPLCEVSSSKGRNTASRNNNTNSNIKVLYDVNEERFSVSKNYTQRDEDFISEEREQLEEFIHKLIESHNTRLEEITEAHKAILSEKEDLLDEVKDLRIKNQILNLETMQLDMLKKEVKNLTKIQEKKCEQGAQTKNPEKENKTTNTSSIKTMWSVAPVYSFALSSYSPSSSFRLSNAPLKKSRLSIEMRNQDATIGIQTSRMEDRDEWEKEKEGLLCEIYQLKAEIQEMKVDFSRKSSCQIFQEESGLLVTELASRNTSESKMAAIEMQLASHCQKQVTHTQAKFLEFEDKISKLQEQLEEKGQCLKTSKNKIDELNCNLELCEKEKLLLKEECDRVTQYSTVLKGTIKNSKSESNNSLMEKTKNLELQTKLSQAEFDSQIYKIRCNNLENEVLSLREDMKGYKNERTQFFEKSSDTLNQEYNLRKECDKKTLQISSLLLTTAMLKSEMERLFLKEKSFSA